jgi:hypothetical protein
MPADAPSPTRAPSSLPRSSGSGRLLRSLALGAATAVALSVAAPTASACGGFFCSATQPVNQAAERILFAKNDDGTVTTVVQILYEGPAERFSWVLPVVGTPEIAVSSDQAFAALQAATNPQYVLNTTFESCGGGDGRASAGGDFAAGNGTEGPEVNVLAAGTVGPFDYEVLSVDARHADASEVATAWLEDNGYDVGPRTREVLGPYLEAGMNLVAFRLTKGATAGSIRPVSLTYPSKRPAIPIRPTAVAANDDMGVLVWVLGEHRAVPTNYYALELNEALIDWFNPSGNYDAVVTAAADEAGGQGFVTEMSAPAVDFASVVLPAELRQLRLDLSSLSSPGLLVLEAARGFGAHSGFTDVLRRHVTLREGWTAEELATCPDCYEQGWLSPEEIGFATPRSSLAEDDPILLTETNAFLRSFDELVFQPLEATAELFLTHRQMTRLYSTLSAAEMTLDPEFDFNPDLEDVSNIHQATRRIACDGTWAVTFADGLLVFGGQGGWPFALGSAKSAALPRNARILELGTSGPGEVVVDNRALIREHMLRELGLPSYFADQPSGGGCSWTASAAGAAPGWSWPAGAVAALTALVWARRRPRAAASRQ